MDVTAFDTLGRGHLEHSRRGAARPGEPASAHPLLERALRIRETAYGPDHPASVSARQALRQLGDMFE
ncbi:MAG: tetratricopeptide repeat protein [Pseudonocardiaceae bacterium]